jgi:hypothetical protein
MFKCLPCIKRDSRRRSNETDAALEAVLFSVDADNTTPAHFKDESKNLVPIEINHIGEKLSRRKFPPVGISFLADRSLFESPEVTSQQVMAHAKIAITNALKCPDDIVRIIALDKARNLLKLNIRGDVDCGDSRSPMQLACELVSQSGDPASPLRAAVPGLRSAEIQAQAFQRVSRRRKPTNASVHAVPPLAPSPFEILVSRIDPDADAARGGQGAPGPQNRAVGT